MSGRNFYRARHLRLQLACLSLGPQDLSPPQRVSACRLSIRGPKWRPWSLSVLERIENNTVEYIDRRWSGEQPRGFVRRVERVGYDGLATELDHSVTLAIRAQIQLHRWRQYHFEYKKRQKWRRGHSPSPPLAKYNAFTGLGLTPWSVSPGPSSAGPSGPRARSMKSMLITALSGR